MNPAEEQLMDQVAWTLVRHYKFAFGVRRLFVRLGVGNHHEVDFVGVNDIDGAFDIHAFEMKLGTGRHRKARQLLNQLHKRRDMKVFRNLSAVWVDGGPTARHLAATPAGVGHLRVASKGLTAHVDYAPELPQAGSLPVETSAAFWELRSKLRRLQESVEKLDGQLRPQRVWLNCPACCSGRNAFYYLHDFDAELDYDAGGHAFFCPKSNTGRVAWAGFSIETRRIEDGEVTQAWNHRVAFMRTI